MIDARAATQMPFKFNGYPVSHRKSSKSSLVEVAKRPAVEIHAYTIVYERCRVVLSGLSIFAVHTFCYQAMIDKLCSVLI